MMNNSLQFLAIFSGIKLETPTGHGGAMEAITRKVPIGWLQGDSVFPLGPFFLNKDDFLMGPISLRNRNERSEET